MTAIDKLRVAEPKFDALMGNLGTNVAIVVPGVAGRCTGVVVMTVLEARQCVADGDYHGALAVLAVKLYQFLRSQMGRGSTGAWKAAQYMVDAIVDAHPNSKFVEMLSVVRVDVIGGGI
jgi:hypothetical protein